ncbi:BRO-N domain-containing protein [Bacillus sp. SD088]|uniref:BRO-N domain-containing protein n=1 Tax=Bacillus sp. SD088 TaxID=2782012 RepID=UPI001A9722E2|nr:Bro-N domain-containing protein [Bacillus sp. SD088]MBO0995929.1 Bro-N domain-containing protein [Bacillus sp. SD088]
MSKVVELLDKKEVLGKELDFYGTTDDPLFLAKDVAEWIEHSDVSKMVKMIDEDEKVRKNVPTLGGLQESWFLTEDGLYEVLMLSRKPVAKQMKKEIKIILKELRVNGVVVSDQASYEQVKYNVDTFLVNLDDYNITKLYDLIEGFLEYHREKKTRLLFKRKHKARHGNRRYKDHVESMEEIRDYLVDYLNAKISSFNNAGQAGLAQEYIRIREMVRVNVENMRYRSAACK